MGTSSGGSGRADAWRPGARGRTDPGHPYEADDWDGDDRGSDRRWSPPADNEGDTW
jgi:hypothetical protein